MQPGPAYTARAINISSAGYIRLPPLHMYIIYNTCVVPYIIMYIYPPTRYSAGAPCGRDYTQSVFRRIFIFIFLSTPDHRTAVKINLNPSPQTGLTFPPRTIYCNIRANRRGCRRLSPQVHHVLEKFHPKTRPSGHRAVTISDNFRPPSIH